jgi:hypothetical protein
MLSPKTCLVCENPLDIHQAARSQHCQEPDCARQFAGQMAAQSEQRHRRNRDLAHSQANATIRSLMDSGQIPRRGDYKVARVPVNPLKLARSDPGRQESYRDHLEDLLAKWETEQSENRVQDSLPESERDSEPNSEPDWEDADQGLGGQACATCRGSCCKGGNTHAYQTIDTIRRWFALNPESTTDDCRDAYLSLFEAFSYKNGCVFHAARGCVLPRRLRSDTCNRWVCWELEDMYDRHRKSAMPVTIIVAGDDEGIHRINVVDSVDGQRLEPEIEHPDDAFPGG